MNATYETYAALSRISETGNLDLFQGMKPKPLAKWLRHQFRGGYDSFISTDSVLSRLNWRRIQFVSLASALIVGGYMLDDFCRGGCTLD